ncbi:MAG: hypothetical protein ABI612_14705 [Betaproteobacteria bacterium]
MSKLFTWLLAPMFLCGLHGAHAADDDSGPKSASQLMHKRDRACEGLKGVAMEQCLGNYVGPEGRYGRASVYGSKHGGGGGAAKPSGPPRAPRPGRE